MIRDQSAADVPFISELFVSLLLSLNYWSCLWVSPSWLMQGDFIWPIIIRAPCHCSVTCGLTSCFVGVQGRITHWRSHIHCNLIGKRLWITHIVLCHCFGIAALHWVLCHAVTKKVTFIFLYIVKCHDNFPIDLYFMI